MWRKTSAKQLQPITNHTNSPVNQSNVRANVADGKRGKRDRASHDLLSSSDWPGKWREIFKPISTQAKTALSQHRVLSGQERKQGTSASGLLHATKIGVK